MSTPINDLERQLLALLVESDEPAYISRQVIDREKAVDICRRHSLTAKYHIHASMFAFSKRSEGLVTNPFSPLVTFAKG